MTNEEAISILEKNLVNRTISYSNAINDGFIERDLQYEEELDALNIAINALDRDIKRNPNFVAIMGVDYPQCPLCSRTLWKEEFYCGTCGQHINRGVENEEME